MSPIIIDQYIGAAKPIAVLRDKLHIARGGTFVNKNNCPDGCPPDQCSHDGEPLNASANRERSSGPENSKPKGSSFGANFGGLMRMLKTSSPAARNVFKHARATDDASHEFISFMHRNFPVEEENSYTIQSWKAVAMKLGINSKKSSREEIIANVRKSSGYMEIFRTLEE